MEVSINKLFILSILKQKRKIYLLLKIKNLHYCKKWGFNVKISANLSLTYFLPKICYLKKAVVLACLTIPHLTYAHSRVNKIGGGVRWLSHHKNASGDFNESEKV